MPLAILTFLASIAYLPGITSAAYAPRWWVLVIAAPLAMLAARRVTMTPGHWLGALFCFGALESLFWTVSPLDTYAALIQLLALAMVFCVAAEQEDLAPTWLALGFGAAVNTVASLVHLVSHHGYAAGLFYNPDFMGAFCAVALIGLIYGVPRKGRMGWLLVVASVVGLLASGSRAAVLAPTLASGTAWALRYPARQGWALGAALTILALVACAAFWFLMPSRQGAISERLLEWVWVVQNLHFFGWGFGTLGSVFTFEHSDNDFVEMAFDLGLLSLPLWLLAAYALKGFWHAHAPAVVLVTIGFLCCFTFPLHQPATAMVAAVALGGLCNGRMRLRGAGRKGAVAGFNNTEDANDGAATGLPIPA